MRCYNGCPDKAFQAYLDEQARISKQLEKIGVELGKGKLRATYFPMEEKWMVFGEDHLAIAGFHSTKLAAAEAALGRAL